MSNTYVLSPRIGKVLRSKGLVLVCESCGRPIRAGDRVVSKVSNRRVKRMYHERCFMELFV